MNNKYDAYFKDRKNSTIYTRKFGFSALLYENKIIISDDMHLRLIDLKSQKQESIIQISESTLYLIAVSHHRIFQITYQDVSIIWTLKTRRFFD